MATAPPKIPAAQQRLVNAISKSVMFISKERKTRVCEILLEETFLEDELLLAMALCSILAPDSFKKRQQELRAAYIVRGERQRAGIAEANARKAAAANQKSPADDAEGDAPATPPPAPDSGPIDDGAAIDAEAADPSFDNEHPVAEEREVLDGSYDAILKPSHPQASAEVLVPVIVAGESSPVTYARRESIATGDHRAGSVADVRNYVPAPAAPPARDLDLQHRGAELREVALGAHEQPSELANNAETAHPRMRPTPQPPRIGVNTPRLPGSPVLQNRAANSMERKSND
jgi:hypothetical protein